MANQVFMCYAREDEAFVLKLASILKTRGIPVWLDQWDIPAGANWNASIDNALYGCEHFLIVLSPTSVRSNEVSGELLLALEKKKHIVPILYQACRIPRQLLPIQHADFTSCSPDDIGALNRVFEALGMREGTPKELAETENFVQKGKAKSQINQTSDTTAANDSNDWYRKGRGLYFEGKFVEAIKCYDKAIELNPKNACPLDGKGIVLSDQKRDIEAIKCYDKAIELDPKFANPWNNKGVVHYHQKMYAEAIKCYDKAIELDSKLTYPWNNKGTVHYRWKMYAEAIKCYDKVIELDPKCEFAISNKKMALGRL